MTGKKVKEILRKKGYRMNEVAEAMGIIPQNLHSLLSAEDIKTGVLERIAYALNVSIAFFFINDEDFYNDEELNALAKNYAMQVVETTGKIAVLRKEGKEPEPIPVYELQKVDNLNAIFSHKATPLEYISLPQLRSVDGAAVVQGDSMVPALNSGDLIVYKKMAKIATLFYGQMYLMAIEVNNDEHITIKYIEQSYDKDHVKLVSANDFYAPMDIPLNSIKALAMVKASVRYAAV